MKIENNEMALLQDKLDRAGRKKEAREIKAKLLQELKDSGDYCPCKAACELHGDCFGCVQIHRMHRGHLPLCMWDIVNERIADIATLTEGSFAEYTKEHPGCQDGAPRVQPPAELMEEYGLEY